MRVLRRGWVSSVSHAPFPTVFSDNCSIEVGLITFGFYVLTKQGGCDRRSFKHDDHVHPNQRRRLVSVAEGPHRAALPGGDVGGFALLVLTASRPRQQTRLRLRGASEAGGAGRAPLQGVLLLREAAASWRAHPRMPRVPLDVLFCSHFGSRSETFLKMF